MRAKQTHFQRNMSIEMEDCCGRAAGLNGLRAEFLRDALSKGYDDEDGPQPILWSVGASIIGSSSKSSCIQQGGILLQGQGCGIPVAVLRKQGIQKEVFRSVVVWLG
jgi:hypothetical protein